MAIRVEIRDARTVEGDVTVDVTDGAGHWMTFTLDDLQKTMFSMEPSIISSEQEPLTGSEGAVFMWDGWRAAKAKAIEEGLIPPENE